MAILAPPIAPGTEIGRYRVLGHIADGGMASIYLAQLDGPVGFQKRVALKVIHRHLMGDPDFVRMFADEARIAARLHHPNIVQTFDLIHTESELAIAMEYAPGLPLSTLYPGGTVEIKIQPALIAYIGAEVAAGLDHAHTRRDNRGRPLGIVHRDITPRNVHLGFDARVHIVDFGIARARGRIGTTTGGTVKGTFAYMSPEQLESAPVDARTDVWGLGVIMWELLARYRLFRRNSEAETLQAVLFFEVPSLSDFRDDIPRAMEAIVRKALERDPAHRWASARELEEALREVLPARVEPIRRALLSALAPHRNEHEDRVRQIFGERRRRSSLPPMEAVEAEVDAAVSAGLKRHTEETGRLDDVSDSIVEEEPEMWIGEPEAPAPAAAPPPGAAATPDPSSPPEHSSTAKTKWPLRALVRRQARVVTAVATGVLLLVLILVLAVDWSGEGRGAAAGEPRAVPSKETTPDRPATSEPAETAGARGAAAATSAPEAPRARLRIEADREDAWVRVDGGLRRPLPVEIADLRPGSTLRLRVGGPGYAEETLEVVAGERELVRVELEEDRRQRRREERSKRAKRLADNPFAR